VSDQVAEVDRVQPIGLKRQHRISSEIFRGVLTVRASSKVIGRSVA
jgi:hypothetical protein